MRIHLILSFVSVVAFTLGCGQSPQTGENATGPASNSTTQAAVGNVGQAPAKFVPLAPKKRYDDPKEAVHDFLIAITTGDNTTATSLMSYAAQRETWSNGLALSSDGFPGSQFKITAVEVVKPSEETHVETTWIDENQNSFPCVWLLHNERNGWCIYAMATRYMENAPPVILDFEDHDKLKRQQERAVQHMQRQQMAAQQNSQVQRIGTQQPEAGGGIQQVSGQQPLTR